MDATTTVIDVTKTAPTPAPPTLQADYFGMTHRGQKRSANEDQFLIAELTGALCTQRSSLSGPLLMCGPKAHLLIVADGMGGHRAGEQASALAVQTIEGLVLKALPWITEPQAETSEALAEFRQAVRAADAAIIQAARENPALQGMGTTVTLAYVVDGDLLVAHAGDSRCYLLRDGQLRQLTRDHTFVGELVRRGVLEPAEAKQHPYRHVVTNAVGGKEVGVDPEVGHYELRAGDALLLCSDGLTEMVANDRIRDILAGSPGAEAACDQLIAEANANGGKDNITCVVGRFTAAR